jgi:hypothetical protein
VRSTAVPVAGRSPRGRLHPGTARSALGSAVCVELAGAAVWVVEFPPLRVVPELWPESEDDPEPRGTACSPPPCDAPCDPPLAPLPPPLPARCCGSGAYPACRAAPLKVGADAAPDDEEAVEVPLLVAAVLVGVLGVLLAAAAPPPPPPPPLGRSTAVPCDGAPSEGRWPASAGAAVSARPAAARASLKLMPLSLPTLLMAPPPNGSGPVYGHCATDLPSIRGRNARPIHARTVEPVLI